MKGSSFKEESQLITWLSKVCLYKLGINGHKRHWNSCSEQELLTCLEGECRELRKAVETGDRYRIWSEAADVANFAAMVADRSKAGLPEVVVRREYLENKLKDRIESTPAVTRVWNWIRGRIDWDVVMHAEQLMRLDPLLYYREAVNDCESFLWIDQHNDSSNMYRKYKRFKRLYNFFTERRMADARSY